MNSLVLGILLVLSVGCNGTQERPSPKEGESPAVPQVGISPEMLRARVLPDYRLQSRTLSSAGLGYHYHFRSQSATVVVTIGLFASSEQARQAAELSHELMPNRPEPEDGIGDQAWAWRSRAGSAIRFRTRGALVRIAGDLPYDEVRSMAKDACGWIASRPIAPPAEIRIAGLPERLSAGQAAAFRIANLPKGVRHPTIGAWASRGGVTVSQDGAGRFVAPSQRGTVGIRCFAIWDDNRISVADQMLQVHE
jgi:hypothetical protein